MGCFCEVGGEDKEWVSDRLDSDEIIAHYPDYLMETCGQFNNGVIAVKLFLLNELATPLFVLGNPSTSIITFSNA